jgi:sulfatase modifying factor 1
MISQSRPKLPVSIVALWLMVASAWQVLAVDPVVSNVQAKQREGSRMVDITYDVADPDSPTLTVYLKVSADGGTTWKGPIELVSGDVGQHIAPGTAKRLVWDAGKEMPNRFGVKYRYRIGASDQWLVPEGMALIPAGLFQMGDARADGPVHTVMVSAFAMDKWEVTTDLWLKVQRWANTNGYDIVIGDGSGAKHPVRGITWYEVVKWNNARSEMEKRIPAYYLDANMLQVYRVGEKLPFVNWSFGYRLPTESEWEKAARGGVSGKFYPWGTDEINPNLSNYLDSVIDGTVVVGSYTENGYGLFDMAGNVYEWCWDWMGQYSQERLDDPRGPLTGVFKVMRGGCWDSNFRYERVSSRDHFARPGDRGWNYGFRSAITSQEP